MKDGNVMKRTADVVAEASDRAHDTRKPAPPLCLWHLWLPLIPAEVLWPAHKGLCRRRACRVERYAMFCHLQVCQLVVQSSLRHIGVTDSGTMDAASQPLDFM